MQNLEEEEESTMSMSTTTTLLKNILPHNVVLNILSRLPVKSLLRFRCVSKPWKIFFSDPSFIKRHLNHSINNNYEHLMLTSSLYYDSPVLNDACFYSIAANNSNESSLEDEAVGIDFPYKTYGYRAEILGSCDGFLLINPYEDIYCIWNPFTKEFKKLPDTPIEFPKKDRGIVYRSTMIYGFGYDKIIEDYKVVRIVRFDDGAHTEVKVYILGSDSWTRIQDMPNYFAGQSVAGKLVGGKVVNGAVHWVGNKHSASYYKDNEDVLSRTILSFNIEDEQYREMQQPNFTGKDWFYLKVEPLDGCLCMVCHYESSDTRFDVWVMRDYGVKESWIKQFTITQTTFNRNLKYVSLKPLKVTNNGELLLLFDDGNTSLVVYDPKHGTAKTLKISGMKGYFETHTFVESLISLNSGTFVGQEQAAWRITLQNIQKKRKRPRGWWKDGL